MPNRTLPGTATQQGLQANLQSATPGTAQLPQQLSLHGNLTQHELSHGSARPGHPQTVMTNGSMTNMPAGQFPHQQQQTSAFQQYGHFQHSFAAGDSRTYGQLRPGAVPKCPGAFSNRPAPPPGFALVPIAPDGTLHYPGTITNPYKGALSFSLGPGRASSVPCTRGWTDSLQISGQPPLQSLSAHWHHQQHHQQQHWQQQQQQQQQQQHQQWQMSQPQLGSQQTRKRKLPDLAVPSNGIISMHPGTQARPQLPVSIRGHVAADMTCPRDQRRTLRQDCGGVSNSGQGDAIGSLPESNANAAAQLRYRLKATAATPSATAGGSSSQVGVRAVPRKPQLGADGTQQTVKADSPSETGVSAPGLVQTADPAEVEISGDDSDSNGSHGPSIDSADPDLDPYKGPPGPDCIRAGDRTQVSMLPHSAVSTEQLLTSRCTKPTSHDPN